LDSLICQTALYPVKYQRHNDFPSFNRPFMFSSSISTSTMLFNISCVGHWSVWQHFKVYYVQCKFRKRNCIESSLEPTCDHHTQPHRSDQHTRQPDHCPRWPLQPTRFVRYMWKPTNTLSVV
jgi:hypothetical protein